MNEEIEKTPEQVQQLAAAGAQLIDVRETDEWDAGRIDGARHIGLQDLTAQAETIDAGTPVAFYCRSGVRSLMAAQAFRQAGYDAYSMSGGLLQWHAEGRPLVPDDGSVA